MKTLVFAPHAAIWIHAFPEALVAESLVKAGHDIVYVTCDRQFHEYCVAMSASGLAFGAPEQERRAVCDRCRAHAGLLRERFPFRGSELGDWLKPDDDARIRESVASASRDDPGASEIASLAVGRFALYQLLIRRKKMTLEFSDDEWAEYLVHLASSARAAIALERLFAAERPDRVLLYNGLYSVNLTCRHIAERAGIPTYFLHAGGNLAHRLQTLMVGRDHTHRFYPALLKHWARFRDRPVPPALARAVTDHFVELLGGRSGFVYSARKATASAGIRERFGIAPQARILVATLGSYDEEFAAEAVGARVHGRPPMFPMQADWVRALCGFAASRPDLFLIVRVHPREYPNRREQVQSQHAGLLRKALADLPANVRVNWPDDEISIYALAEETDVFLNSWSSVGKEMSLLGLPVVTYAQELLFYPPELNYSAKSPEQFFAAIDAALADGWSAERIRLTYRWLAVEYGYGLVDIADGYAARENETPPLAVRAWNRARRIVDPLHLQKRDCARRPDRLQSAASITRLVDSAQETVLDILADEGLDEAAAAEEDRAIRSQMARLLPHLYPGETSGRPGTLQARLREFAR